MTSLPPKPTPHHESPPARRYQVVAESGLAIPHQEPQAGLGQWIYSRTHFRTVLSITTSNRNTLYRHVAQAETKQLVYSRKMYRFFNVVFERNEVIIPRDAIDAVIHYHLNAAQRFLENIYILLTQKSIPLHMEQQSDPMPHYAFSTVSNRIKNISNYGREQVNS